MDHSQIPPNLFVGSSPKTDEDIDCLKLAGITGLLNLQTESDFRFLKLDWALLQTFYRARGIEIRRVPIQDFNEADLEAHLPEAVDVLHSLMEAAHVVFVHCKYGLNRSPTIVVACMHWWLGWDLEAAECPVRTHHRCDADMELIRRARK
jgi:protein-tyrosine phosphatase